MRIFLVGAKPSFDVHKSTSLQDRLKKTGGNAGNQVIAHGLLNRLVHDEVSWDPTLDSREINARFDHVVIAAANFLHSGFDLGYLATFLKPLKLPITIAGLGAQSNDLISDVELPEGTERMLAILADRCARIGVRGEYTADLLARRGITNVQVIGCPSYYADYGHALPETVAAPSATSRIVVNASRDVVRHAFDPDLMRAAVHRLMNLAVARDAMFVAQTEREEMVVAESYIDDLEPYLAVIRGVIGEGRPAEEVDAWARRRCRVFWNVEKWLAAMKGQDLVIGTRFHGALVGLLAGVPSLVVCHDSRTTEMAEFLRIPRATLEQFEREPIEDICASIDLDAYRARRPELLGSYRDFLTANGLTLRETEG